MQIVATQNTVQHNQDQLNVYTDCNVNYCLLLKEKQPKRKSNIFVGQPGMLVNGNIQCFPLQWYLMCQLYQLPGYSTFTRIYCPV